MYDNFKKTRYYVDVLLPLALPQTLTYSVPEEYEERLSVGIRVVAPLRDRKLYSGILVSVHKNAPEGFEVKDIADIIDSKPVVNASQLKLWQWIASYYMCSYGEVMKAALPSGLKLESETKVRRLESFVPDDKLDDIEKIIIHETGRKACTLDELARSTGRSNIIPRIKKLIDNGAIAVNEEISSVYRPKYRHFVHLSHEINNDERLLEVIVELEKARKQHRILLEYLSMAGYAGSVVHTEVPRDELIKKSETAMSTLRNCESRGILVTVARPVSRVNDGGTSIETGLPKLNPAQQKAADEIKSYFGSKPVLLRGITSSGKTEIYIRLIDEQLQKGKQALYLLPEIALTTQIITRLRSVFGDKVGVYHSRLNEAERIEIYNDMLKLGDSDDSSRVILGVRSSLFLPFTGLGLIIVDEEHETTYKQYDPAPRYNARDSAVVLASIYGADVLMGSATPAIESYYNALAGKYGLVELTERYGDAGLPAIEVIDMISARKKKKVTSHFSHALLDAIRDTIERNEQVMLFQNRRGFSPLVQCNDCGHIPRCKHCDVSLTCHKYNNRLTCHYCGYTIDMPPQCPACGSPELKTQGFGTEKIEDELAVIIPDARVARLDLDATRTKHAYEKILSSFGEGKIDILVGTRMITKGLDFANVSLVGVMNADNLLSFPDFRAYERSFQLMSQVAGRAGRASKSGKVLIQTSTPANPVIGQVVNHDYLDLFASQIEERREFFYPPYCRLIVLTLKHVRQDVVLEAARALHHVLFSIFAANVAGPEPPPVGRINNKYLMNFRIKLKRDSKVAHYKQLLRECYTSLIKSDTKYAGLQIVVDVDPG